MKDLSTLSERAKAVERSVVWWDSKMNAAIDEHEAAVEAEDEEAISKSTEELKSLLRRAEMEKVEMVKIESEINQAMAEAAFSGNYSSSVKRNKNA
tara:strand:- start:180 stop:467 length:288 start_codon:yes stop_codon:yes gene_type:complete